MLALAGGCLFWFGHNFPTFEQVDDRIRGFTRPLQVRCDWLEKELLNHKQQKFHPALGEELRRIEQRMYQLEPRK